MIHLKKRGVSYLLIVILLFCYSSVAFADTISDKQKELKNVKEDIQSTKSDIEGIKGEQQELIEQIADIEADLDDKKKQLTEIEEILKEVQKNIELTQKELEDAIRKADAHKELMDERICAMYMSSNVSYLEILLDANSVTDFLNRVEMIKEIMTLDQEVLEEMQAIKEEIEERKEVLEAQEEVEEGTKREIVAQKEAIEEKQEEKEALLAKLKEQQKKMETDLDKLEKNSKGLEAEIQRLISEREEQKRRERERERARALNSSRGGSRSTTLPGSKPSLPDSGSTIKGNASAVIGVATRHLGKPYVYGASGPSAFDCSGFTSYVFRELGVSLPRTAATQANCSTGIKITSRNALKPGDLVFFSNSNSNLGHAGIYIGGGQFIHASSSKKRVVIESIDSDYRRRHFRWGRRIFN